jgi:hypothetical protein
VHYIIDVTNGRVPSLVDSDAAAYGPGGVQALRVALAPPVQREPSRANTWIQAYNYSATAANLLGLHVPHIPRKETYLWIAVVCGAFALLPLTMIAEKPLQSAVVTVVFGGLCAFFLYRWRVAEKQKSHKARQEQSLYLSAMRRWEDLLYCAQCRHSFVTGTSTVIPIDAVQSYLYTGHVPAA